MNDICITNEQMHFSTILPQKLIEVVFMYCKNAMEQIPPPISTFTYLSFLFDLSSLSNSASFNGHMQQIVSSCSGDVTSSNAIISDYSSSSSLLKYSKLQLPILLSFLPNFSIKILSLSNVTYSSSKISSSPFLITRLAFFYFSFRYIIPF